MPVDPPADVLARLKEIDPRAELAYVAENTWMLGRMMPMDEREQRARELLQAEEKLPANLQRGTVIRILRLYVQGFRVFGIYPSEDVHSQKIVLDFKTSLHGIRTMSETELDRRVTTPVDPEAQRIQVVRDYVDAEFRQIHRRAMRGQIITH